VASAEVCGAGASSLIRSDEIAGWRSKQYPANPAQKPDFVYAGKLVRPDADNAPSSLLKRLLHRPVSLSISNNFRVPIFQIGQRTAVTAGATMPEATVNKYDKPPFAKNEVRLSVKLLFSPPAGDSMRAKQGN
jgi:hypothetical protein